MNLVTHGLASYVVTKAIFPRAPRMALIGAVVAGTAADLDGLSAFFGAPAFLGVHYTFTHSIIGAIFLAALVCAAYSIFAKRTEKDVMSPLVLFAVALCAAGLHVAMDACGSDGVALLWPIRGNRYALDWVASLDLWILVILIAAALLPALFGLVRDEIGSKTNTPRGRLGFAIAMSVIVLYISGHAALHANAVAMIDSRAYRAEIPRRVAALPEAVSPFVWNGLVETASALHQVSVRVLVSPQFDPDTAIVLYKPEPSAILDAAKSSRATQAFLRVARCPKATITQTENGFCVELRDLRYAAAGETRQALAVRVDFDADGKIREQKIVWERELSGK